MAHHAHLEVMRLFWRGKLAIQQEITDLEEVRMLGKLLDRAADCDYASNLFERTWPRALDTEVFFTDTLARMERLARTPATISA